MLDQQPIWTGLASFISLFGFQICNYLTNYLQPYWSILATFIDVFIFHWPYSSS